jgi:oligoendopeptidase F
MNKAKAPRWDLSDFYVSPTDARIAKDKATIQRLTSSFIKKYKGKINSPKLTSSFLAQALANLEKIEVLLDTYVVYAHLVYNTDTVSTKVGKFYQEAREFGNDIATKLLWFDLEWLALPQMIVEKLLKSLKLSKYTYYLSHSRVFKPFTRPEPEEIILTKKTQTGRSAFVRLYDEIDTNIAYELKIGKRLRKLTYSQITSIIAKHPNRKVREDAAHALTQGLLPHQKTITSIMNNLLLDKKVNDEIRGHKTPQEATILAYDIPLEVVTNLVNTTQNYYTLSERFYKAKAKYLRLKSLHEWDRYSSIYSAVDKTYSWGDAKEIVLTSFYKFSTEFHDEAKAFFDNNWIDALSYKGKSNGAFCNFTNPTKHPLVLMNFEGKTRDVTTLAHELGHAVHASLSRNHSYFEFHPSTATAEIASILAESIVFDDLLSSLSEKKLKINLLADKIQEVFATVFRQTAFYLFESDIHEARRNSGELSPQDFGEIFQKRLQAMFGKGLILTSQHKSWWMPIRHFFHHNFYVFTYTFGELLTLTLFSQYKKAQNSFVDKYLQALKMGGSKSPQNITKSIGADITDPHFWEQGFALLNDYIKEFERLTS